MILNLCNSAEYAHLPPSQIVPKLADKQIYVGSKSTFYRVLLAAGQRQYRERAQRLGRNAEPTTHAAHAPNRVWSWDVTHMPPSVRGKHDYL